MGVRHRNFPNKGLGMKKFEICIKLMETRFNVFSFAANFSC